MKNSIRHIPSAREPKPAPVTGAARGWSRWLAGWLLLVVAVLALPPAWATPGAPRIVAVDHLGDQLEVVVDVPAGVARLVLEGCRRGDLRGWAPRAYQRVDQAGRLRFTVAASVLAGMELFRVRADEHDPLPASFYTGRKDFAGESLGKGTAPVVTPGTGGAEMYTAALDASTVPPGSIRSEDAAMGGNRAVVESDIWRLAGDRLYFFNSSRGLQIIDVSTPDTPVLRAALPLAGAGEQMYVLGGDHVVLLASRPCAEASARFTIVVVSVASDQPRELARLPLAGNVVESRLVGRVLYVATQLWEAAGSPDGAWQYSTVLQAFDLAQPATPVERTRRKLTGSGTVVAATETCFFITTMDWSGSWLDTTLHVFDITDPTGVVEEIAAIPVGGRINDKFKLYQRGDLLVVVSEGPSPTDGVWRTELGTYRLLPADDPAPRWKRLGGVELARNENVFATRFDGDRAYVVTYRRVDPLWVVDFSDPARPAIKGELTIPGWSTYIHPLGDRLFTVGIDDTDGKRRTAVQLFNVADPASPALLAKVVVGDGWSYSEANENEKALGVFPEAGLALLPFSSYSDTGYAQGVQLIDLGRDTLKARGVVTSTGLVPRRSTLRQDRILAVSNRELLTVDASNRDQPVVKHRLELAYPVDRVLPVGEWLLEFSGHNIRVSPATAPGAPVTSYPLDEALWVMGATAKDGWVHLLQYRPPVWGNIEDGKLTLAITNPPALRHTVLDATALPNLTLKGVANTELPSDSVHYGFNSAEPLWPLPGVLAWSLEQRAWDVWTMTTDIGFVQPDVVITRPLAADFVTLHLTPAPSVVGAPSGSLVDSAFDSLPPGRYWYPFWWGESRLRLYAFEVSQPAAPRFLSRLESAPGSYDLGGPFTADGLVYWSRSTNETQIIGTNVVVYTNSTWVAETNLVFKTNLVYHPIVVTVTNALRVTQPLDGVKLYWSGPAAGSLLAGGARHSLGVNGDGVLFAWGDNAAGGVNPSWDSRIALPLQIPFVSGAKAIAAGIWQSYAADTSGAVWKWGELNGPPPPPFPGEPPLGQLEPPEVLPLAEAVSQLAAGNYHALGLSTQGTLWSWGQNGFGQLGLGHRNFVTAPTRVDGHQFQRIAAGGYHSLALDAQGHVFSWGRNDFGQLARDGSETEPLPVPALADVTCSAITAGSAHSVALAADGRVWAWGDNRFGQMGRLDDAGPVTPQPIAGLPPIRAIAAGGANTLALAQDGTLWTIGNRDAFTEALPLAQVEELDQVVAIGAGRNHALALQADGQLFSWGSTALLSATLTNRFQAVAAGTRTVVDTRIEYVIETNIVEVPEITQRLAIVTVTNLIPIHQYWRRYFLDVADYTQDPAAPVVRDPVQLPGLLKGVSHAGSLLYTWHTDNPADWGKPATNVLSALAYDGLAAHLVASLIVSTNAWSDNNQVEVIANGVAVVTRGAWNDTSNRDLSTWRLNDAGQFERLGTLALAGVPQYLRLIDDLALLRTNNSLGVADLVNPAAPVWLPVAGEVLCYWYDLKRVTGDRETGLWLPAGEWGTANLWLP